MKTMKNSICAVRNPNRSVRFFVVSIPLTLRLIGAGPA